MWRMFFVLKNGGALSPGLISRRSVKHLNFLALSPDIIAHVGVWTLFDVFHSFDRVDKKCGQHVASCAITDSAYSRFMESQCCHVFQSAEVKDKFARSSAKKREFCFAFVFQ